MTRQYWSCQLRLDGRKYYFLWFQDDKDGVVLDGRRRIRLFTSKKSLELFAKNKQYNLDKSMFTSYDLDKLTKWLHRPSPKSIRPSIFLDLWNLFTDLANSRHQTLYKKQPRITKIYDKLFFGCNLPAIRRGGPRYYPKWKGREVTDLAKVLEAGLRLVRRSLPNPIAP